MSLQHNLLTDACEAVEWNKCTPSLRHIDLSHNRLVGRVPEVGALGGVETLRLNNNRLSGKVGRGMIWWGLVMGRPLPVNGVCAAHH